LLEWSAHEENLYIIEPAFLFFVRWRLPKEALPQQLDFLYQLLAENMKKILAQSPPFRLLNRTTEEILYVGSASD